MPVALTVHRCPDEADETTTAVAILRCWRLMVAALREDSAAIQAIIAELEGCSTCLSLTVTFLANAAASGFIAVAHDDRARALAQAEKQLGAYMCDAQRPR